PGKNGGVLGEPAHEIRPVLERHMAVRSAVDAHGRSFRRAHAAATAERVRPDDPVADAQGLADRVDVGTVAHRDDPADHLVAEDQGQPDVEGERTLPTVHVRAAQGTRDDFDEQTTGLDLRGHGYVLDTDRLAERADDGRAGVFSDGGHALISSSVRGSVVLRVRTWPHRPITTTVTRHSATM